MRANAFTIVKAVLPSSSPVKESAAFIVLMVLPLARQHRRAGRIVLAKPIGLKPGGRSQI